jgi:hypothetical protein
MKYLFLALLVACSDDYTTDVKPDHAAPDALASDAPFEMFDSSSAPDGADANIIDAPKDALNDAPKDALMCWANGEPCNNYLGDGNSYTLCCSGTTPNKCVKDQNGTYRCIP